MNKNYILNNIQKNFLKNRVDKKIDPLNLKLNFEIFLTKIIDFTQNVFQLFFSVFCLIHKLFCVGLCSSMFSFDSSWILS